MESLKDTLKRIAERHDERMKTDARYAMTVAYMQQATSPVERSRHYDRDGYCDSPYRGY